jgi:hypothetical protein
MNNILKEENNVYVIHNTNIENSKNFLKNKNDFDDIKYYIYNIYLTFIIRRN